MSDYQIAKREPRNNQEKWLIKIGWRMVGLQLLEYPNSTDIRGAYTLEKATEISEELGLDLYCPVCGACGIDGCCSPDRCRCLHREQYNEDYKTLLEENERLRDQLKVKNSEGMYPEHKNDQLGINPLK